MSSGEMQKKLRKKMAESKKQREGHKQYAVFQCHKCRSQARIMYDRLVPFEMLCIVCGGRVRPKVVLP